VPDGSPCTAVVLISGEGSNLQAIIDHIRIKALPVRIAAVISNRADAFGLKRAAQAGIATHVLASEPGWDRETYDKNLQGLVDSYAPALIVLAGFMRILTTAFVERYRGRILNIHPALLPAFRGLNTHQRALDEGVSTHGASVHFVTEELDGGPVIVQARVPVFPGDNARRLAERVLQQEHRIYPLAIRWFAEGRIAMKGNQVYMDGTPLDAPVMVDSPPAADP